VKEAEAQFALEETAAAKAAASKTAEAADGTGASKAGAKVAPRRSSLSLGLSGEGSSGVSTAGSGGDGRIPTMEQDPLRALEWASSTARMHHMWLRRPAPVLPFSTVV